MIDIDHFKRINDTYGHGAGDLVLVQVAGILSAMFAREDVICRFGGGEFCVLSTSIDRAAARNRFAELRRRIQATIVDVGHAEAQVTVSIGLSQCSTASLEDMIREADSRLFVAKSLGRNRVVGPSHEPGQGSLAAGSGWARPATTDLVQWSRNSP